MLKCKERKEVEILVRNLTEASLESCTWGSQNPLFCCIIASVEKHITLCLAFK
jgi:hypothetical protein